MIFNSFQYFLFLPAVWLTHYLIGERFRWLLLLVASLIFYASLGAPYLLGVITLVTAITYRVGLSIHRADQGRRKKQLLWGGISANILVLAAMKYVPFLTENINALLGFFHSPVMAPHARLFVAVGVSYYVFQAVSYLSDIYLEIEEPEPHLGYFALYLAFFPKLLQGPIERGRDLLPQLRQKYEFNYDNMRFGLLLFTWGLFKKVVLADRLGLYVDDVYDDVHSYRGVPLLFSTYAYALQIYFDFSGYTDMALGTARLFNIKLTDNFNSPYLATSVADFWRRWHITFSRWILDYIFKPLQMSWRKWGGRGSAAALILTFLVSGLWHGASWGFIIWGLLHGLYMAVSVFYRPHQKKIHGALGIEKTRFLKAWQIFLTFNLICLAWIFFRANTISDATYILSNILAFDGMAGLSKKTLVFITLSFLIFSADRFFKDSFNFVRRKRNYLRWGLYYALVLVVILFSNLESSQFLYFGF